MVIPWEVMLGVERVSGTNFWGIPVLIQSFRRVWEEVKGNIVNVEM